MYAFKCVHISCVCSASPSLGAAAVAPTFQGPCQACQQPSHTTISLDLLSHFVKKYCLDVEVISECLTYRDALVQIDELKPDLLFLDIVLDENTAFDLLKEVKHTIRARMLY